MAKRRLATVPAGVHSTTVSSAKKIWSEKTIRGHTLSFQPNRSGVYFAPFQSDEASALRSYLRDSAASIREKYGLNSDGRGEATILFELLETDRLLKLPRPLGTGGEEAIFDGDVDVSSSSRLAFLHLRSQQKFTQNTGSSLRLPAVVRALLP